MERKRRKKLNDEFHLKYPFIPVIVFFTLFNAKIFHFFSFWEFTKRERHKQNCLNIVGLFIFHIFSVLLFIYYPKCSARIVSNSISLISLALWLWVVWKLCLIFNHLTFVNIYNRINREICVFIFKFFFWFTVLKKQRTIPQSKF